MQEQTKNWLDFSFTCQDGLKMAGRKYGWQDDKKPALDKPVIVCLPGQLGNAGEFHLFAKRLARRFRILALEYRGRGASDYDRELANYDLPIEARDVIHALDAAGVEHAGFIGNGYGANIIMSLASMRPALIKAAVFNDYGPQIAPRGIVRIKNYLLTMPVPANWEEAEASIKKIFRSQFTKFDDKDWQRMAHQFFVEKNGKLTPDYDPKLKKIYAGIDLDFPLEEMWEAFEGLRPMPLLLIRGKNSDVLSPDTAKKMQAIHTDMRLMEIEDQGHMPDLSTEGLPGKISSFINSHM